MNKYDKRCSNFLRKVNDKISPLLRIEQNRRFSHPMFDLVLRENYFVMEDQVVLKSNDYFVNIVKDVGVEHFGVNPSFNNTRRSFWFI